MATAHALLVGGGLLLIALVIMVARNVAPTTRLLVALAVALAASGASAFHHTSGDSGTGTVISRGFPRPYHFQRSDPEAPPQPGGRLEFVYFGANALLYFGAVSVIAALLPRKRESEANANTMAGRMLMVRILLGILFLILAVIGGFVPILQGWVFFLLAILVFFPKAKFTEKVLHKAEPKLPRVVAFLRRIGIGRDAAHHDTVRTE